MMKVNKRYGWLWSCLIAGSLLFAGCSDSYEETPEPQPAPQPQPEPEPLPEEDCPLVLRSFTRTSGATPISPSGESSIYLFACTPTAQESAGKFDYSTTTGWGSTEFSIKEERQYYLYGFMPATVASGTLSGSTLGGDYSAGANMTLTGLPVISSHDICALIGVESTTATATTANVTEGNFGFLSKTKNQNYANLLMDHLYTELELGFRIDPGYAALRSIHLKEVTLTSSYQGTITATVRLRDQEGIRDVSYARVTNTSVTTDPLTLLSDSQVPGDYPVLNNNYPVSDNPDDPVLTLGKTVFCAPNMIDASGTYLTITTKYEVWDKDGTVDKSKIEDRTAVNKLKLSQTATPLAQKRKVTLNVKPTYLYVLSDWDMDHPDMVISE